MEALLVVPSAVQVLVPVGSSSAFTVVGRLRLVLSQVRMDLVGVGLIYGLKLLQSSGFVPSW